MSQIREIEIKKTELATLAIAYKWPVTKIAAKYGVEPKEITAALISFGLRKGRTQPKEYQIVLRDDLDTSIPESLPTAQATPATSSTNSDNTERVSEQEVTGMPAF